MRFRCEGCGQLKPNEEIEVMKFDISESMGFSKGTATRNVNYCHNNPDCVAKAKEIVEAEKIRFAEPIEEKP